MSQRDSHDDLAFGSDSFLDVVANIVGILIILIVVAGLRVSQAPVVEATDPVETPQIESQPTVVSEPPILESPEIEPIEIVTLPTPAPEPEPPRPIPNPFSDPLPLPLPRPDPTPPPELVARAEELEETIRTLAARATDGQNRQRTLQDQLSGSAPQLSGLQRALAETESDRNELEREARSLAATMSIREQTLSELQAELLTARADGPETEVLSHRMTPVGRAVTGPELHFRLEGNRVSVVPVDALAGELKNWIERNRDMLLRMHRYEGTVGPRDGYEMRYLIREQRASVVEELRYGRGYVKMAVTFWELIPQENFPSESADEAVRQGSRFYRALQQTGPRATLTLWVYPDSFELHRRLQEFAQSAGFEVAARPLPYGVPIAGSPNGSRSMAQ